MSFAARALAITGMFCLAPAAGIAQEYPVKPVRILVGFAPGGGTDIMARAVGAKLSVIADQTRRSLRVSQRFVSSVTTSYCSTVGGQT